MFLQEHRSSFITQNISGVFLHFFHNYFSVWAFLISLDKIKRLDLDQRGWLPIDITVKRMPSLVPPSQVFYLHFLHIVHLVLYGCLYVLPGRSKLSYICSPCEGLFIFLKTCFSDNRHQMYVLFSMGIANRKVG